MYDRELVAGALSAYDLEEELGRGGWGVVWRATHRALGRPVAVKHLPRAYGTDPGTRRRFLEEARVLSTFDHPHVVQVFDFVEHEGLLLIVMELVQGGTLWQRFCRPGVRSDEVCAIGLALCSALEAAHELDILHRDVKPENVLFTLRGVPKLADFGLAKLITPGSAAFTVAGEILGTPAYLSPEQATGRPLTAESDLYSLGVVLYELFAGRLPFDDNDPLMLVRRHADDVPPALDAVADVPGPLAHVVMRSLAKRAEDRHHSAVELGIDLARAAGRCYGPGWLSQAGVPLLGSGPIVDEAMRGHLGAGTWRPSLARAARPDRHEPPEGEAASVEGFGAAATLAPQRPPTGRPEVLPVHAPEPQAEQRSAETSGGAEPQRAPGKARPAASGRHRRGLVLALGAVVVLVVVALGARFLFGGRDSTGAGPPEFELVRQGCLAGGGTVSGCGCLAASTAGAGLDAGVVKGAASALRGGVVPATLRSAAVSCRLA